MNRNNTLRLIVCSIAGLFFIACNNQKTPMFTVEGTILGAEAKTLYLEDEGKNTLDSVILDAEGNFRFQEKSPAYMRFYDLRLDKQIIYFVVDSIETIQVKVNDAKNFAKDYTIAGLPDNEKIKELSNMQISLAAEYRNLQKQYENQEIDANVYMETLDEQIKKYKEKAAGYIVSSLASPVSVFALLQQVDRMLIFSPDNKDDLKLYGAVANNYPESPYRKQLEQMYLQGLAENYKETDSGREIDIQQAEGKEWFEVKLPSNRNHDTSLSEVGDNKITLVDFTIYEMQESPARIILLAELYEKYHDKGFEIYQISLDNDEHFWLNAVDNLPWTTVRDPQTIYSDYLKTYNVLYIPSSFLRDRSGDIIARINTIDELEQTLKKYIK